MSQKAHPSLAAEIPLGTVREIFTYNRTFGDDPRMDHGTLAAWDSLVPNNQLAKAQYVIPQGARRSIPCLPCTNYIAWYVRMPLALKLTRKNEDAENILTEDAGQKWSIHQSYYGALQSRRRGEAHHHDYSGPHMRHCFDYLRQGLMCAADSTLEPVDTRLGGVTGWGDERVCRDYAALKDWAEKRRVSNSKGFSD
ncbi:hypothetical protein MGYG_08207 [Nannizzia gypsea CBS 118893]|uniref:Uncharacterized protein n=1 Tax=Arthroderma gypseum (strain ATCC MYA-4604 / CBS 118893) TaxID=535722 RepID=E4V5B9_ARTGP|nr:hypothetical protein MGYG_08207 [Nannizzia gypsea CBS 118893]EFR05193.1 hypothetical protein MGYG_08207 [Nannizzia gypsea CBS 118893]